jgi:hypothetical protein
LPTLGLWIFEGLRKPPVSEGALKSFRLSLHVVDS